MKAVKTIVATAVIVLALTTVAAAGARQVGSWNDAQGTTAGAVTTANHAQAQHRAISSATHHDGGTHHGGGTHHRSGTHHGGGTHHG